MAQNPDLILFVGDIIDSQIEPIREMQMDKELARLSAPLGVFLARAITSIDLRQKRKSPY